MPERPRAPVTVPLASASCPRCGFEFTHTTQLHADGRDVPTPGALAVCISCAAPLVFAEDLSLREATDAEVRALTPDEREGLVRTIAAAHQLLLGGGSG